MTKKLEFDLEMLGPKQVLINIVEEAGYTYDLDYYIDEHFDWSVRCKEMATCEEDVRKFVKAISDVTGLEFDIDTVDGGSFYEDIVVFYTRDLKFGEEVYLAKNEQDCSCYFGLAYSKEGKLFY